MDLPVKTPRILPGTHALHEDDRATVVRDYQAGESIRSLAARYRVGYGTVWRTLDAAGIERRRRGSHNAARTGTRQARRGPRL